MAQDANVIEKEKLMASMSLTASLAADGTIVVTGDKSPKNLAKGSGSDVFHFTLTDNSGHNVCFAPEPNFLGIDETGVPPNGPGINTDQVPPDSVKRTASDKAQFKDLNSRACTLGYTLFFQSDGPTVQPFDPIIINGGQ